VDGEELTAGVSAFCVTVAAVVSSRAEKQMLRIHTGGHVAAVKDAEPIRDFADVERVGVAVSE